LVNSGKIGMGKTNLCRFGERIKMKKKIEWTKPVLVELGNARRMTFGSTAPSCIPGTGFVDGNPPGGGD
jgi:hypothetical protein